jgi:putative DNA primase/helicase
VVADRRKIHPVRDWLKGLKWDRRRRLDRLVPDYLGGADTEYTRAVGAKWMISAVARVMRPGCQADYALILESPEQGRRKSSAFRAMVPEPGWYSETPINIGDKDSYQNLRGVWLYGLDELDSVRRGEATKTKTFLTATRDRYRPSYARRARDFPRQNVFCGSTNEEEYFTDRRNRRYWPVRITRASVTAIERDRKQLWAEAAWRFAHGEQWWPNAALERLCSDEQADRVQADDWQGHVEKWCCEHDDGEGVFTVDALTGAIRLDRGAITRAHTMRVADVLRAIGYTRGERVREGEHVEGREGRRQVRRYVLADEKERRQQTWRFAKVQRERAKNEGAKGTKKPSELRPPRPPRSAVEHGGLSDPNKFAPRSEVVSVVSGSGKQGGSR